MSYKTFASYNSDNIVKTIEEQLDAEISDKTRSEIDRALKKAVAIYIYSDGLTTRYEKLQNGHYFDWRDYGVCTVDEMCEMLNSIPSKEWEAEYV